VLCYSWSGDSKVIWPGKPAYKFQSFNFVRPVERGTAVKQKLTVVCCGPVKNVILFAFSITQSKNELILVIFSTQNPEEVWNNWLWIWPPHLKNVTALPCEMQNSFTWLKWHCFSETVDGFWMTSVSSSQLSQHYSFDLFTVMQKILIVGFICCHIVIHCVQSVCVYVTTIICCLTVLLSYTSSRL